MANVHVRMIEDRDGNLIDVEYFHGFCAPDDAGAYPAPDSQDKIVYCESCKSRIDAIGLTKDGARELMHGDPFLRQYAETALWSETDWDTEEPLDATYTIDDIDANSVAKMFDDCKDFRDSNRADLENIDDGDAGHNFWLTRNRHGAGFWDRGLGEIGQRLTDASHVYGECNLYASNGIVYLA